MRTLILFINFVTFFESSSSTARADSRPSWLRPTPEVVPSAAPTPTPAPPYECPKSPDHVPPSLSRADVYKDTPFEAGEIGIYEVSYMGLHAGYGALEVKQPVKYQGVWHRVFNAKAKSGEWYKAFFQGEDKIEAFSRPWDWGIGKFYMEQYEAPLFAKAFIQKKWLEFNHADCKVIEKVQKPQRPEQIDTYVVHRHSIDALGVVFKLRTHNYELNKPVREDVYTSEKNWILEALPIAFEKITVPAGTFDTVKIRMHTYLGKELQQKGEVYIWLATKTKQRELVQVQGDIKIGSIWLKLSKYSKNFEARGSSQYDLDQMVKKGDSSSSTAKK